MSFSLEATARQYVHERFSRAKPYEQEKLIQDWIHKPQKSAALVRDLQTSFGTFSQKRVLDIGSGNGGLGIALTRAGANVSGIDVETDLHAISKMYAEAEGVAVDFRLYDGTRMPFEDATFDFIISISVLEHVDDPETILKEAHRVLKPGGIFFLAFPNRLWPKETHSGLWGITYLPYRVASWIVDRLGYSPLRDNNLHFYTYWNLQTFLRHLRKEGYAFECTMHGNTTHSGWKHWIKRGLWSLGIPHQAFLPHLMCVLRKS